MGGIGGVIRDWEGKVVKKFSGPVNSLDANGAEIFALLVGCVSCSIWEVKMQLLKETLFLLFSGARENLLFLGDWQIGWRRCKPFLLK